MAQQNEHAGEPNKPEKVLEVVLVPDYQAAVILQPGIEPLDLPAPPIAAQDPAILGSRLRPIAPVGGDQLDPALRQAAVQGIAVIGPVPDQPLGERRGEALGEERLDEGGFVGRSAGHVDGERKTSAVCHCQDLRTLAPDGGPHAAPPFFAGTKQPSIKHSDRSSPPRRRRSSAKLRSTCSQVPARTHSW